MGGKRDSVVEHLETAKDLARKRAVKILARLRLANQRIDELTTELSGGEAPPAPFGGLDVARPEDGQKHHDVAAEQELLIEAQTLLREQQESLESDRRRWRDEQRDWEALRDGEALELEKRKVELDQLARDLESARQESATQREQLEQAREEFETRQRKFACRQETGDVSHAPAQTESGRGHTQHSAIGEPIENVEEVLADLAAQRETLRCGREEVDAMREAIGKEREAVETDRKRCEALAEEIEKKRVETERQSDIVAQGAAETRVEREAFIEEQRQWEAARLEAQRQVEQRAEKLDRQMVELDERSEALASDQADWEALKAEAEAKLAARAAQLDARERELDQRPAEYEPGTGGSSGLPFELTSSGDLEFFDDTDEREPAASSNSLDLFRQLGTGGSSSMVESRSDASELRGATADEQGCATESDQPEWTDDRSAKLAAAAPPTIEPTADDNQEESIEHYMAGLLSRANGGRGGNPSFVPAVRAPVETECRVRTNERETAVCNASSDDVSPSHESTEADPCRPPKSELPKERPRARAPERAVDLVSLRELANLSAHSALNAHARKRLWRSVNAKLAVVAVALATASVLFWRWTVTPNSHTHYYMGLAVLIIAILWGVHYGVLAYFAAGGGASKAAKPNGSKRSVAAAEGVTGAKTAPDDSPAV